MTRGSIRLRLLIAAAVSVVVALALAGLGLTYLFERHVERRVGAELETHLTQLIAGLGVEDDGTPVVENGPTDPRFDVPASGLYWQVEDETSGKVLGSRSLWDSTLALPKDDLADGAVHEHEIAGPDGTLLLAREREITLGDAGDRRLRLTTAVSHDDIEQASRDFAVDLGFSLTILAVVLIVAAWVQVLVGLLPLERLRTAVAAVVSGHAARLDAKVPQEVQPLAAEINRLLDVQAKALVKARSAAADLAHGLKTPLQVLLADIRALRQRGETGIAEEIDQVAVAIRRHVDRELARARAAPVVGSLAECRPVEVAERVVSVVRRTPRGEALTFAIDIPAGLLAPIDAADLSEILGNLIENAARFAVSRVVVGASEGPGAVVVTVADDGPGIPADKRATALKRGARLDLGGDGAGLGLAIVADLAEVYGGSVELADAGPGLKAIVKIPRDRRS